MKVAIYPGSFDPITYGHIDIVKRAAAAYDKVYLAVMINSDKQYTFDLDERKQIAETAVADIANVEVISSDGMLWELARDLGADAIVKGYRNHIDLEYETRMAEYNESRYPNAKTVLLPSKKELEKVSSTEARKRLACEESIGELLPICALKKIEEIISKRK